MKEVRFDTNKVLEGVKQIASAVKMTMGAKGRTVIIDKLFKPAVATKDGMTVAKEFFCNDPAKMTGCKLVQDMTKKIAEDAGDGTTAATVLLSAILNDVSDYMSRNNVSVDSIRNDLNALVSFVEKHIDETKIDITDPKQIMQVATISMNGDEEMGRKIMEAAVAIGKDGVITVEESKNYKTEVEITTGMQIPAGYLSPYFCTNMEKMFAEFDNPAIFLTKKKITHFDDIAPVVSESHKNGMPLLIVCNEIDDEVMNTLVLNRVERALKICVVKQPEMGDRGLEYMRDVAIVTGAKILGDSDDGDFTNITLGNARRIKIEKDKCIISQPAGIQKDIDERVKYLKEKVESPESESMKNFYTKRLANITGGIAVIKVGGLTEAEVKEKKDRIDDAVAATKCAIEDGIVEGGGVCLMRAALKVDSMQPARDALFEPYRQILRNAGYGEEAIENFIFREKSIDVVINSECDMIAAGIIDPAKVVKSALKMAVSTAKTILSSGCVMTEIEEKDM